jgi:hypothetical protein
MSWKVYEVVLRLRSSMHIGWRKAGNLQMTRPYVTGRALWGALTMRLTRDKSSGSAIDSAEYRKISDRVNETLAFTYFYPALKNGGRYQVVWPWENKGDFRRCFLSSYRSTALSYPARSAAEGLLHEIEFLSPYTLDSGKTVFLKGYVFEKDHCDLNWRSAFNCLQLGGERGYGWGDVECVKIDDKIFDHSLFDGAATFKINSETVVISVNQEGYLLAHTVAGNLKASGEIEPLVGREWRSDNTGRKYAGQHVEFNAVCFVPGSKILQPVDFSIGAFGVWHKKE